MQPKIWNKHFQYYSSSQIQARAGRRSYSHEILHVTEQFKPSILPRNTTVILQLNKTQLLKLKNQGKRDEPGCTFQFPQWGYQQAPSNLLRSESNCSCHSTGFSGGWKWLCLKTSESSCPVTISNYCFTTNSRTQVTGDLRGWGAHPDQGATLTTRVILQIELSTTHTPKNPVKANV